MTTATVVVVTTKVVDMPVEADPITKQSGAADQGAE